MSPDGSMVFVTGKSYRSATNVDYATIAYDASTGTKLWVERYNGPGHGIDVAMALGVSPDGSMVFVTGQSDASTTYSPDYATIAYKASSGHRLWAKHYNGPSNGIDIATALDVSPDGSTVFVTGRSDGSTTNLDYTTVAYDASTGRKLWVKRFNGPVSSNDEAKALRVSPDGSTVFVTGFSYGSTTNYDYATVAYDAFTGTKLWAIAYNGPANGVDEATALDVRPDGSIVVVTGKSEGSTRFDYATVAYGASAGTQLWVRRYNGPANGIDKAAALSGSPDGSMVFVTGLSDGSTSYDYATVAYDGATGSKLWVERYDGPLSSIDAAKALGVSPDGSTLFVTGKSFESTTHFDYATVAYDASAGTQLWATLYSSGGGPGGRTGEGARALGISPDGSTVFVTGESSGATTSYDYATVAYRTT